MGSTKKMSEDEEVTRQQQISFWVGPRPHCAGSHVCPASRSFQGSPAFHHCLPSPGLITAVSTWNLAPGLVEFLKTYPPICVGIGGKPEVSPKALFLVYQSTEMPWQVRSKYEGSEDKVRRHGIQKIHET